MAKTVSDFIVERLRAWNIERIYGYPGDGINGVVGAIARTKGEIDFVQVAHEELASLMACAHAKFGGGVGVCLSTGGPGAIHLLNGLYDAKLDHQPLVALVGQSAQEGIGANMQQETDLYSMLKDVGSAYIAQVAKPEQVRHVIDRAFRVALGERTVTVIILPHDVQSEEAVEAPPPEHGMQHSTPGYVVPRLIPSDSELDAAAEVLNAGDRIAILVGAGALSASKAVAQTAERLQAGVAKALLGKAVLPDALPYVTGSVGWLGTPASNWMMEQCDTLLLVGTMMPYTEFLPKEGQARGVQIDIAPRNLGLRYPVDVMLAGDADETLRALLRRLHGRDRTAWRQEVVAQIRASREKADEQVAAPAQPINPQRVVRAMSDRLPDGAVVTADSGSSAVWLARYFELREGMKMSVSGGLATMGCGIPYASAAKFVDSNRLAVAVIGDGAMQMSGMSALIDVAKYYREWKDRRLIVVVLNNRDLNYVTWEQRVMEGEPRFARSQSLPDIDYAAYARLLGLDGIRIDDPAQIDDAWTRALGADRPFVIDAVVDADVPTLPPTVKPKLEEMLAKALSSGDPNAAGVREQLAAQGIEAEPSR
ncbi:MAG TPA: thiamine pyrophosphate-requiring protein [Gemmatimonadaceae bacterium]|jgi:pyruvate dehydrogenase (quinone)